MSQKWATFIVFQYHAKLDSFKTYSDKHFYQDLMISKCVQYVKKQQNVRKTLQTIKYFIEKYYFGSKT